jgi:predicted HAD superfamily Cof-like phosphohydrolase
MTNPISADISIIKLWFERAVPEPTDKNRAVQLGVHFEEVQEMATATGNQQLADILEFDANYFKQTCTGIPIGSEHINRKELLDSLCDQIVTAVGVAHMFGLDIAGALSEVNRSNWSKFDSNGQPIFDANGKIAKGKDYSKPNLDRFL